MRLKCHPLQSPVSENGTQRGQLTRGGQRAPAGKNFFFFLPEPRSFWCKGNYFKQLSPSLLSSSNITQLCCPSISSLGWRNLRWCLWLALLLPQTKLGLSG